MQKSLTTLIFFFLCGTAAFAQSDGWPGNCSLMQYPQYKQSTIYQFPPGYQPPNPSAPCSPLDSSDKRLVFISFLTTGTTNFTCTQTAGDDNGKQYHQEDSSVVGKGACFTHAIVNDGTDPPIYPITCHPEFKPYVTYAQNSGDYNRFYNLVQFSSPCRADGSCVTSSYNPLDESLCTKQSGAYDQTFAQCTGKWGDDCIVNPGGGPGGGCAFVPGAIGQVYGPLSGDCGSDDPIILDVEGEGFHLTSPEKGVKFDMENTGHAVQIAWTDPRFHNAFLVLDINGDGMVDSGKELFGNFTPQPKSEHPNGFLALALYDLPANGGNGDGVIDAHDAVFSKLRLWIDANHDGISEPGELYTLDHFGIRSLSFGYMSSPKTDQFGNSFRYRALVNPLSEHQEDRDRRKHNGEVGRWAYDVFLVK